MFGLIEEKVSRVKIKKINRYVARATCVCKVNYLST